MEPVHPADIDETKWGVVLIVVLYAILGTTLYLGHWDELVAAAVEWFPYWHWGG